MPKATPYPIFLPNAGYKIDRPSQFLNKNWSPYSRNMEFVDEEIWGRLGIEPFDTTALSGPILLIKQFWNEDGTYDLLFFTTKDIYLYDFGNTHYDFLTPSNTTGTVEVQAGTPTILRGTGTHWKTAGVELLKVGDFVKLGAGNYDTDATWYQIDTVTSDTQLVMTAAMPTTAAGSAYVARRCFAGGTDDIWDGDMFFDTTVGNMFIATNGIDTPVYYTETATEFAAVATLPTGMTTAKYVRNFFNRVIWLATVEGGQNLFFRIRWSLTGVYNSYDDLDFNDLDLPSAAHIISGAIVTGDYMVIPKIGLTGSGGAYIMRVSVSENDFDFQFESDFEGNRAPFSLVRHKGGFGYFATDNRFRYFNLLRDEEAFPDIDPEYLNADPNLSSRIYGFRSSYKNQMRWAMPYDDGLGESPVLVYDYAKNHTEIWGYKHGSQIRCIGEFLNAETLYVDDPVWATKYVDEETGYWDDQQFLENAPIILYGCADGKVYKADTTSTDNGTSYTRVFRLSRQDFKMPQLYKRLAKQQWWLKGQSSGTLSILCRLDDNLDWEGTVKTIDMSTTEKDVIKSMIRWNKRGHDFDFQVQSTSQFGVLGVINYVHKRRNTVA